VMVGGLFAINKTVGISDSGGIFPLPCLDVPAPAAKFSARRIKCVLPSPVLGKYSRRPVMSKNYTLKSEKISVVVDVECRRNVGITRH